MSCKSFTAFLLLALSCSTHAQTAYLDSYAAIRDHLLKGGNMNVIVNNKTDCTLISQSGPIPFSPNIYGMKVQKFAVKAANGNIELAANTDFNEPVPGRGIPPNYHNVSMQITPQGKISVEEVGISLFDYNVSIYFLTSCVIGNEQRVGVKFIPN